MNRTKAIVIMSILFGLVSWIIGVYLTIIKDKKIAEKDIEINKLEVQILSFINLEMRAQQSIGCLIGLPEYSKGSCDKFLVEYVKQGQALSDRILKSQ